MYYAAECFVRFGVLPWDFMGIKNAPLILKQSWLIAIADKQAEAERMPENSGE